MKSLFVICTLVLSISARAQTKKSEKHLKTFKMDSITLKEYYFVMLVKGPDHDKITDTAVINKVQGCKTPPGFISFYTSLSAL